MALAYGTLKVIVQHVHGHNPLGTTAAEWPEYRAAVLAHRAMLVMGGAHTEHLVYWIDRELARLDTLWGVPV